MLHKFMIEIDTDEATTDELQEAIYQALKGPLVMDNGDCLYVDFPKVEIITNVTKGEL
jgi:hypothetical protein